MRSDHLRAL